MINDTVIKVIKKRTKIAKIRISNDFKVTAIVPMSYTSGMTDELINKKKEWINKTLRKLKNRTKEIELADNEILLFGEKYKFELDANIDNKILTYNESKKIVSNLNLTENRHLLINWYKHLAHKYISKKSIELAEKNDFKYERLFIRNQKTKWGTCSSRKNISFNWRLIMCPEYIIEYIIIHELSHLKEMNHSGRFWEEVEKIIPNYKIAKSWLIEYESYIFRI